MSANGQVNYKDFDGVFELLLKELIDNYDTTKHASEGLRRFEKVLRYNVPVRVKMSGYVLATAYEKICERAQTLDEIHLSYVLGWCWRMLLTFLTMLDENFGGNANQFGKQTWFHFNNGKPIVIVDSVLVEQGANCLLRKYFGNSPHYSNLLDYFSDATFEYLLAKPLEQQLTKLSDPTSLQKFTMANWLTCARNINSKCLFAGPTQLAMILAGVSKEEEIWIRVERFCDNVTEFWAVKRDLKDSFEENGLVSDDTNIKMGICSWLIAKALEVCDQNQWYILDTNYGKDDKICVSKVKNLFTDLRIPEMCKEHLNTLQKKLKNDCEDVRKERPGIGYVLQQMLISYGGTDY